MPAGIHKGRRVLLTIDQDTYAQWQEIARMMGNLPVATAMRNHLEAMSPGLLKNMKDSEQALAEGKSFDELMGRAVWEMLKAMTSVDPSLIQDDKND